MILFDDAIERILSNVPAIEPEEIHLNESLGRITAVDLVSRENIPSFNNSAMDGFAFRYPEDKILSSSEKFKVVGVIAAGDDVSQLRSTGPSEAWEIMTGASMPIDCDSVIKVEDTCRQGEEVVFNRFPKLGSNVRKAGEDFSVGDCVVKKGTQIFPEHVMALAALGVNGLKAVKKPRVGVISTGAELTSDGPLTPGKIRNSTAPYLMGELALLGTEAKFLGSNSDDPKDFLKVLRAQIEEKVDIVISTGAVSMGKYDFVATALRDLGAEILFHKIAIRPGKPLLFARLGKTTFFGIPGNPVSTAVAIRFFVEPYLRKLRGEHPEVGHWMQLKNGVKKPEGLRCFFKARSFMDSGTAWVEILKGQESFKVSPLLAANSWVVLPEAGASVEAGEKVRVFGLHSWGQKEVQTGEIQ